MPPAFLVTRFGPAGAKAVLWGGAAILAFALLSASYWFGRVDGVRGAKIEQLEAERELEKQASKADANAADRRVTDAVRNTQQEKELKDALEATNDPDRQRALRGCVILRQQGFDTIAIPACR